VHSYRLTESSLLDAVIRTEERGGLTIDDDSAALDVTAFDRVIRDRLRSPFAAVFVAPISHRMAESRRKKINKQLTVCTEAIELALLAV
jgi:DNA-binding IclR family transcriptional regulator